MPKIQTRGNLALAGFDDIFGNAPDASTERIVNIPLGELFPPEFHPFLVRDDQAMSTLAESIRQYGVRVPGLARSRAEGGYELLAGNRRKRACELAGIAEMPVIVRETDDDEAVLVMIDTNLEQRETLLPSEKAWAYRLKLEALNHRGKKSDASGQLSVDVLCEQTGENKNAIFRLIRLTELVPALADKVDDKKLALNPAVELSYLTRTEQAAVVECMAKYEVKPSVSQAQRMKRASQDGGLMLSKIESILAETKKGADKANPAAVRYSRFFPDTYTPDKIDGVIIKLLTAWRAKHAQTSGRGGEAVC